MPRYKEDPIPTAPFVRWVDRQIAARERAAAGITAAAIPARGKRPPKTARAWNGSTGAIEQVCYRLGWEKESGARRLHRWRTTDDHAERRQIEDALFAAGVAMDEVYAPPTPAWRAMVLLLAAIVDLLTAELVTLRYCPSCCQDTLAVDHCLWCDAATVDRSPLRDDPRTGPMLESVAA